MASAQSYSEGKAEAFEAADDSSTLNEVELPTINNHGRRFWCIIAMLCLIGFAATFDNTIIFVALPTIIDEIGGNSQSIWIANAYVVASVAAQPFVGKLCNIFGRKNPFLASVVLFAIGAGVAGGATNSDMLIAGRTIQGLGCGGISVLIDLIVCDITSQRERGKYLGIVLGVMGIGSTLGPLLGGALVTASWRWVFYITLPFSGLTLIGSVPLLRLKSRPESNQGKNILQQLDIFGNFLFIASICSVCIGLIQGGSIYPWSSYHVIVPLVLGLIGWIAFHIYEASPWCHDPTIPPVLFSNRTASVGFVMTFIFGMMVEWLTYMLPFYFQAVRQTSPLKSAVNTLPFMTLLMPFGILGGGLLAKTGRYRLLHAAGFAFVALGCGLFSTMNSSTKTVEWVFWQLFVSLGLGLLFTTVLPAIQASLPEKEVASSTATYSFMRSFGIVWGVVIPTTIMNSRINHQLKVLANPTLTAILGNQRAYSAEVDGTLKSLPPFELQQSVNVFTQALKAVWYAGVAFNVFGFLLACVEKHYNLKQEVNNDYGIEEKNVPEKEKPGTV